MASSYSDLSIYRQCPRLFGFSQLGYKSAKVNEPMTTGQFTHAGIAAYFRGQDAKTAISEASYKITVLEGKLGYSEVYELQQTIKHSVERAIELTKRYIAHWAKDYKATLVEPEFELHGVIIHPDLIAFYQDKRVIVDFKTSYHPNERWYDISGQADLYAYVLEEAHNDRIAMIIYDVISEEGIFRHMRPPRLGAGEKLFRSVQHLNNLVNIDSDVYPEHLEADFLNNPHPDYTCPSRCNFFVPCWMLETGTWEDCRDYLEENFLK